MCSLIRSSEVPSLVVSDGRITLNAAEPPDHSRSYIPSRDLRNESHRLATFGSYPNYSPADPRALAECGFYYEGCGDRVKCYSCGHAVDEWTLNDNPRDAVWHEPICEHTINRLGTSASPSQRQEEHLFPCANPVNPHMREHEARMQTFNDHSHVWSSNRIRASPSRMADAGLFYLGERDRVKCWYCNGGLQNWEIHDDPFFEHAKWFPTCEYILRQKGVDYVYNVTSLYPNISRPTISNAVNINQSGSVVQQPNTGPQIVDPRVEMQVIKEKVDADLRGNRLVAEARTMGFEITDIKRAYLNHHLKTNSTFSNFQSLVEAILILPVNHAETSRDNNRSTERTPVEDLREQLRQREQEIRCKICRRNTATVVFLPCGHLVTCADCAGSSTTCVLCALPVVETVKAFMV